MWLLPLAESQTPAVRELDPLTRAIVLMAIVGILLAGFGLVMLIAFGGRWVRRLIYYDPHKGPSDLSDPWWEKPLIPPLEEGLPQTHQPEIHQPEIHQPETHQPEPERLGKDQAEEDGPGNDQAGDVPPESPPEDQSGPQAGPDRH